MDLVLAVVPFLAFLACPLMMLVCVVGMRRMGHGASQAGSTAPPGSREERVAALQRQPRAIRAELDKEDIRERAGKFLAEDGGGNR